MLKKFISKDKAGKALTKDTCCPSLTFKGRIIGFVVCLVVGILISIGLIVCLFLIDKYSQMFGIFHIISSILIICASFFFCELKKQLTKKKLKKNSRRFALIAYIFSLIATISFFICYFFMDLESTNWHKFAMLGCCLLQSFTSIWYSVAFIPLIDKVCQILCFCDGDEED